MGNLSEKIDFLLGEISDFAAALGGSFEVKRDLFLLGLVLRDQSGRACRSRCFAIDQSVASHEFDLHRYLDRLLDDLHDMDGEGKKL